jgi:hypothetical protein
MPAQFFQIITTCAQLITLLFIAYYFVSLREREKELKRKEGKMSIAYRGVLEEALEKEKKILHDATNKADQIIADAQTMSTESKKTLDLALQKITADIEKETTGTAGEFTKNYEASLKQLAAASLNDFESVFKEMKIDVQKETKEFHDSQLSALQKEMDEYKQAQFKRAEQAVSQVIQKVSQEILGSTISLEDHHKLLTDSLEKAKREGMFE